MARTSLAAAKQELHGLITAGGLPAGVTVSYAHEPASGNMQKPAAVTIFTAGMNPFFYLIALRIYVSADADAVKAQDDLDTLIMLVDSRMTSGFGPSSWDVDWNPDLGALVATNLFEVGREDTAGYA